MKCPLTYTEAGEGRRYSRAGLHRFSRRLDDLKDLPYTAEEQRREASQRAGKMSVQGIQPKLSAMLNVKGQSFDIVDSRGEYILKPPHAVYPELPENEDLTMRMAAVAGVETPLHGLMYGKDNSMTYIVKRFDRTSKGGKLAVEDFGQLSQKDRETKYDSSMERVADILEFCTFPIPEKLKLLRLTTVNFLVGNEDAHLKNFSLITRDNTIQISPAYDILNSTIALKNPTEELALPLQGKKKKITRDLLFGYFAQDRLGLRTQVVDGMIEEIKESLPIWIDLIGRSFLSDPMKDKYYNLLDERRTRLGM